jgi:hypothetical protein
VSLTHETERYALSEGAPLDIDIRGRRYRLTVDEPLDLTPSP